jgi:hypothetical protein
MDFQIEKVQTKLLFKHKKLHQVPAQVNLVLQVLLKLLVLLVLQVQVQV